MGSAENNGAKITPSIYTNTLISDMEAFFILFFLTTLTRLQPGSFDL